jgi:hypothetical protein
VAAATPTRIDGVTSMAAKYILAALAVVSLVLGAGRVLRDGVQAYPESRTWLLISIIFCAVSAWLFFQS